MRVSVYQNTPNGDLLDTDAIVQRPLTGIWWCTPDVLVAVRDPFAKADGGPRIDSDLAHANVWPLVARHFGRLPSSEYFDTPRGRVQLPRREGCGMVLAGPATGDAELRAIAQAFGLPTWLLELDDHYSTGADADALFNEA